MNIKKLKIGLSWFFAIVPAFCILIDLVGNTIYGITLNYKEPPVKLPFDEIFVQQIIFFSVWSSVVTSAWGFVNVINYFKKDYKIAWGESENVLVMIGVYNFISSLIYSFTMVIARDTIVGFSNWYNIIKSILEHWVVPITLLFYCFLLRTPKKSQIKKYASHSALYNIIIPSIYIIFIVSRSIFLNEFVAHNEIIRSFPYSQIDPYDANGKTSISRIIILISAIIAAISATYALSIFFEFFGIKSSIKFSTKFKKVFDKTLI